MFEGDDSPGPFGHRDLGKGETVIIESNYSNSKGWIMGRFENRNICGALITFTLKSLEPLNSRLDFTVKKAVNKPRRN